MYVKVKSGGKFFIIKICDPQSEDFTSNGIVISILNKLNLELEGRELQFKDRDDAEIDFEELAGIICQYRGSSSFFVEICLDEISPNNSKINKELELYLRTGDYSAIFNEYAAKQTLSDTSRRCLLRESINFLRQRCGNYPKREDKISLAEAINMVRNNKNMIIIYYNNMVGQSNN